MKEFLHGCRTDINSDRKELNAKDGERVFKTKRGTVVAKELDYDLGDTKKTRFLIATYLGSLYDPTGGYSNRETRIDIKLKSANKESYTHYVRYLQTQNRLSFIAAERSFLNGN